MIKMHIKNFLVKLFNWIINSEEFIEKANVHKNYITTKQRKTFKHFGENSYVPYPNMIINPQYICIGNNFSCFYNVRIEAWDKYREQNFTPEITIGNNVTFNTDCHIGCINKVVIGNNVLVASRVYISDHSHGDISLEALENPPEMRNLVSKGPVIIEDNVWIGEGVCIMPGVTIGKNSIIGANAVVTKNFPANTVIAGVPAAVIKILE